MTFRCTRHFFLPRKESMIFEGMTFVVLVTGFSNFACFFWLQNREWLSLHKALLFPSGMSFRTTKERMTFCCIRHHFLLLCMSFLTTKEWIPFCVASDNIMHSSPFLYVFSDDISLHPPLSFLSMYVFSDYKMSFPLLYVFSDHKKRGRQFVACATLISFLQKSQWYLVSLEMLDALPLRKEKVVLAARRRNQRYTRGVPSFGM